MIGLRVLDDTVLQPPAGVPVTERPLAALVPLARARARSPGPIHASAAPPAARPRSCVGVLGIASGLDAVYYTRELGLSADDVTGWLAIAGRPRADRARRRARCGAPAGAPGATSSRRVALGVGVLDRRRVRRAAVRHRRTSRPTRPARSCPRTGSAWPVEDVTFESSDGLKLRGWYVPSRNGAAVIVFPAARARRRRRACSPATATACCSSTAAAKAVSEGQPNMLRLGRRPRTSRARSRSSSGAGSTASAGSASPSAAR